MNSVRPGLVRGSMMMAVALIAAGTLSLLTSIVLARWLGAAEFGVYAITISLQGVVSIVSGFSLGTAVAKYIAEYSVRDAKQALNFARTGLRLVLLLSIATAVVYFTLADLIGNGLYDEPQVADLIPFSAMVVFSSALLAFASGVAQGNHRMNLLSSMLVSTPAISLGIIVALLPYVGVRVAFMAIFTAQMTVTLSAMYRLRKTGFPVETRLLPDSGTDYRKLIFSFAVPAVIGAVMVLPFYWFGNTVLALESGFLALGHFAVAMVFFQALSVLPHSLVVPLIPRVSEMSVRSNEQIESLVSRSVRAIAVLFFPLFFAIALFSREVIGVLYGSEYNDSTEPVYLMVAACYYFAMGSIVGAAIAGLGRMWVGLGLNMMWAAIFAVVALITIPTWGPAGLGFAYVVSYGIHLINSMIISEKVLKLKIRKVLVTLFPPVLLFAAGIWFVTETDMTAVLTKLGLLAVGTAVMLSLGRGEFRLVLDRVLNRESRA